MADQKLEWMYRNSNEVVDREEYLLGKPIDKAFEQNSRGNEIEKDCLPTSIFANSSSNIQVDVIRKLKEDPLEVIRQQEIERRKQLLKNPVKLKKLQNMLKEKQSQEDEGVRKKKQLGISSRDESQDIDSLLTSRYLSLMKKHGIKSLAELSSLKIHKKKKKKKTSSESSDTDSCKSKRKDKKHSKSKRNNFSESDVEDLDQNKSKGHRDMKTSYSSKRRNSEKRSIENSDLSSSDKKYKIKMREENFEKREINHKSRSDGNIDLRGKRYELNEHLTKSNNYKESQTTNRKRLSRSKSPPTKKYITDSSRLKKHSGRDDSKKNEYRDCKVNSQSYRDKKSKGLSEEEKQKKLEEMMSNAKWRDDLRIKNVIKYKKEDASENKEEYNEDFMRNQMLLATSSGSVEARIKSNINNIQRSKFSMSENFVRR